MKSRSGRALRGALAGVLAVGALCGFAAAANAEGSFVIGDQNAVVGANVTFWGAQWWKLNSPSTGTAPASFKGFANTLTAPLGTGCESPWTTDPGNSSDPPAAPLPPLMEVLVTSSVSKSGRVISGDTVAVALVETNPGYAPNPGHAGTGTVLAIVCKAGESPGGGEEISPG
jgi:hypothetical protein